jgi:hypothetical protein
MPTFFFHMQDGENSAKDEEGAVFEDQETAASEARASARDWAVQIIQAGGKIEGQVIEMFDDAGVMRLRVPLRMVIM